MLQLRVWDETYEFDDTRVTIAEARLIKKYAGMGVNELFLGLRRGDPDAMAALAFLVMFRAGKQPRWRDFDDMDMVADFELIDDGDVPDGEREDEELDPTRSRGTTRKGGSTTTSRTSRPSTTSTRDKSNS